MRQSPSPYLSAVFAAAYIGAVATLMRWISSFRHDTPDTIVDSAAFLSLLVFSAAVMAFLFFYQPVVLLVEGKKEEALSYLISMLGTFGIVTLVALSLLTLLY